MVLKDLIVVLGSVRMEGKRRRKPRLNTRRRSRLGQAVALEFNLMEQTIITEPEQWRAARRFVKNSNDELRQYYVKTPIGNVALASAKSALAKFRERAMAQVIIQHNARHRDWRVLVEGPTWADLGEDAKAQLLTLMAENLPPSFFESP